MNCDQAFDVMTSLRQTSDSGLQLHMVDCPRCRDMLHTLEPVLSAFRAESVPSPAVEAWVIASEGAEVAAEAAKQLSMATPAARRGGNGLWGYTAAVVLGAGLVWCTIVLNPSASSEPSAQRSRSKCLYLADSRPVGMTALQMTQSCLACHAVTDR